MPKHRAAPDRILVAQLHGEASYHAGQGAAPAVAVAAIREIAQGRSDLLAAAAGSMLGAWLASPGTNHPDRVLAAGYLVLAGADPVTVTEHVNEARGRSRSHKTP